MTLKIRNKFWKKIRAREKKAFEEFYDFYYPLLFARTSKFVDTYEECEELAEDTLVIFWEKAPTISPEKHFMEAYLWQILRSQISKFYSKRKKEEKYYLADFENTAALITQEAELLLDNEDLKTIIKTAIKSLPEKTKDVFVKSRINGFTYGEIAEELNISIKTVEYHISKALSTLRVLLKDY